MTTHADNAEAANKPPIFFIIGDSEIASETIFGQSISRICNLTVVLYSATDEGRQLYVQKVSAVASPRGHSGSASEVALMFRPADQPDEGNLYSDTSYNNVKFVLYPAHIRVGSSPLF